MNERKKFNELQVVFGSLNAFFVLLLMLLKLLTDRRAETSKLVSIFPGEFKSSVQFRLIISVKSISDTFPHHCAPFRFRECCACLAFAVGSFSPY